MPSIEGKNVLVTGGAGFIGSHLCDALLEKGAGKVVCLDNFFLGKMENIEDAMKHDNFMLYRDDARNFGVVQAILEREEIEVVFNGIPPWTRTTPRTRRRPTRQARPRRT